MCLSTWKAQRCILKFGARAIFQQKLPTLMTMEWFNQSFWLAESLLEAFKTDSYGKARRAEQMDFYFSFDRTTVTSSIFKCLSYFYNSIVLWKRPLLLLCGFPCLSFLCFIPFIFSFSYWDVYSPL